MKKHLILSLIVGLVNVANSGLHLNYDYSIRAISVSSDVSLAGGIYCCIGMLGPSQIFDLSHPTFRSTGAPFSEPQISYFSGEEALGSGFPYNLGIIEIAWGDPLIQNPAGFWCSPVSTRLIGMNLSLDSYIWRADLLDSNFNIIDHINFIPEPASLLLLGTGVMMIRKR